MRIVMKCAAFNPCFYDASLSSIAVQVSSVAEEFPQFVMRLQYNADTVFSATDEAIADAKGVPAEAWDTAREMATSLLNQSGAIKRLLVGQQFWS